MSYGHRKSHSKSRTRSVWLILCVLIGGVSLNLLLYFGLLRVSFDRVPIPSEQEILAERKQPHTSEGNASSEAVTSAAIVSGQPSEGSSGEAASSDAAPSDQPTDYKYSYSAQSFQVDLSAFEMYMNPEGDDYLYLVNAEHPLSENDTPTDLTPVVNTRKDGRDTQKMRLYAEKALEALFLEAEKEGMLYSNDGYRLSVTSAYRSYSSQKWIFNDYVEQTMAAHPDWSREQAEEQVISYSSRPGTSEHQSGLCCDMHNFAAASSSNGMREQFAANDAGKWLVKNCAKFGFILRYPSGKEDKMCGVGYESWHFRYVGRYHAMRIMESGLCLEEYLEILQ